VNRIVQSNSNAKRLDSFKRKAGLNYLHVSKIPRGGGEKNGRKLLCADKEVHPISSTRGGGGKEEEKKSSSSSLFPISLSELPQFLSMSLLMFLFIYVFTTVRDTKDTLVVSNCGAEAIPFLKLYGVMPSAFLFIWGYTRLSQIVGKRALFYITLMPFFLFYASFAFILFPNRDIIHFAKGTASNSVAGKAAFSLVQYWSYSLYFIVSELWASAGVPLLFWQVANDVTPLQKAKRFYPLFAVIGNLAPIASGKIMAYIVSLQKTLDDDGFGFTLKRLATIKIAICIGIITLYNLVYVMSDNAATIENIEVTKKRRRGANIKKKATPSTPAKKKLTLLESMKELSKSKELKAMATMVFCYNTCIELTEVLWKGILRKTYSNKSDYMAYMAKFSQSVGYIALALQLSASTIISQLGWKWAASLTPLTMVILAIPFFVSASKAATASASTSVSTSVTLVSALTIGTWQNVASKVTKYSLFDPCKEMAYIPLGPDAKVKGKAAVDVLGARLGRSMGSATQQILVSSFFGNGNILNCAPSLGLVYVSTVVFWMRAVHILASLFKEGGEGEGEGEGQKRRK